MLGMTWSIGTLCLAAHSATGSNPLHSGIGLSVFVWQFLIASLKFLKIRARSGSRQMYPLAVSMPVYAGGEGGAAPLNAPPAPLPLGAACLLGIMMKALQQVYLLYTIELWIVNLIYSLKLTVCQTSFSKSWLVKFWALTLSDLIDCLCKFFSNWTSTTYSVIYSIYDIGCCNVNFLILLFFDSRLEVRWARWEWVIMGGRWVWWTRWPISVCKGIVATFRNGWSCEVHAVFSVWNVVWIGPRESEVECDWLYCMWLITVV